MILFLFLSYLFDLTISVTCPSASFPKVLGGNLGNTSIYQIDYHAGTDVMVGVGVTADITLLNANPIATSTKKDAGVIALYKGPNMAL